MGHKEWKTPDAPAHGNQELRDAGYTELLSAVLLARGLSSAGEAKRYLSRDQGLCQSPFSLPDMEKAVERIKLAIGQGEHLAVYGDYDVDGITSSCLICDYLTSRGSSCEIYIPDRIDEGYGLNITALQGLRNKGVSLVITVDCGITAVAEAEFAKSIGLDLIITDHHECPQTLPQAVAIVDPKRPDFEGAGESLAGVGVAFKLVCALENDTRAVLDRYADLVAVGTIADVMPLMNENRSFVYQGLKKLKENPRPGFEVLLEEAGAADKPINASTVGFTLAPRINAAGRLCKTETSVKLLLAKTRAEAQSYATELCELNRYRQELEGKVWQQSMEQLSKKRPTAPIVLESESWHPGVVGIAASRLSEEFELPAIMICLDGENGKGSCRSYGDFNLFDALIACAGELESFGGHAFAAGLNIKKSKIEAFRAALAAYYTENPPSFQRALMPELLIDQPELLSMEGVSSLDELEPCGGSNPRPLMCICSATLESVSAIGGGKHLRLKISKNGQSFDCVYFSHTMEQLELREGQLVDLCFVPQINEFHSRRTVQLLISDMRPGELPAFCKKILESQPLELSESLLPKMERERLGQIWRDISSDGEYLELELTRLCREGFGGKAAVELCLGLRIFSELGLLSLARQKTVVKIKIAAHAPKASLEDSALFRAINA